jgi:hypothetical protein
MQRLKAVLLLVVFLVAFQGCSKKGGSVSGGSGGGGTGGGSGGTVPPNQTSSNKTITVTLTWGAASFEQDQFLVESSTDGQTFAALGSPLPNTQTSLVISNVDNTITHYYRIRSYNKTTGSYSGYANVQTIPLGSTAN